MDFLLSDEAGKLLSASEFHALPTRPEPGAGVADGDKGVWSGAASRRMPGLPRSVASSELDYERVADHVEGAMGVCGEVLGR